jgi:hypothetical protein
VTSQSNGAAGVRRGFLSGLTVVALLFIAAFPARLAGAMVGWGTLSTKVVKVLSGTLLDLSAVVALVTPLVALLATVVPLVITRVRGTRWQRVGAALCALPFGWALWLLTIAAAEIKSERGSFPTAFDLLEGGTNPAFLEGTLGFVRYERIWLPAAVGTVLVGMVLFVALRRPRADAAPWQRWGMGLIGGLGSGTLGVLALAGALAAFDNRFTSAFLGDPMTGLVESTWDLLRHQGPATPRDLVLTAELPPGTAAQGASLLGWPADRKRPLDFTKEPPTSDPRGRQLVEAFTRVGEALFVEGDPNVAVFQLSLEGFRADDLHALNAAAPRELAPFVNSLYEGGDGVLTSRGMYQSGVRTAHGLGGMTCGLGTLPYNLSFIRDLQPFPVRCTADVLFDAGFRHSFFYGSDGTFDAMDEYFKQHGDALFRSQNELPKGLPKGTWDGVSDFAVFDAAVAEVAAGVKERPQFSFVMSLSNHSPFPAPEDLPPDVNARVDQSLKVAVNRADGDDRLRLVTYSYTDAAVERLFAKLDEAGISERSIVMLLADHSTGHSYVWGKEAVESDAAKAQIPFALVIPKAFLARARDPIALTSALKTAQSLLDAAPLSQNDLPTLVLAMMSAHPSLRALPEDKRWHTLGGQVTSPYFKPGGDPASYILGINGVSELFALDKQGQRVGGYEDSVFLKTRADRYRVTPRLIPITATLIETMKQ